MEKHVLTIEFRYYAVPKGQHDSTFKDRTITIGVYDSFEDACKDGNALMEKLESKFDLHVFPSGITASKDRFSKRGGCFGSRNTLITNSAYLKTPFEFYAKIGTLRYDDVDTVIDEIVSLGKTYRKWRKSKSDDY